MQETTHPIRLTRLRRFQNWLMLSGQDWIDASLADYQKHLLAQKMSAASINAYISTVRQQYRQCLGNYRLLELLTEAARQRNLSYRQLHQQILTRLTEVKPLPITLPPLEFQSSLLVSETQLRCIQQQLPKTLVNCRNLAIISLICCTRLAAADLIRLQVEDNRLFLPHQDLRYSQDWCLPFIQEWRQQSGITTGVVFRALRNGHICPEPLTTKSVYRIFRSYHLDDQTPLYYSRLTNRTPPLRGRRS